MDGKLMEGNLLSLVHLANTAVAAGLDVGFNAAGVERWLDAETFEPRLAITWGDQREMRRPKLRIPMEWALSYDEESPCSRQQKTIEFPDSIRSESAANLRRRFHAELLELA
jgi:hypothetical protein